MSGCYVAGKMGVAGAEYAIFASEQQGDGPIIKINPDTLEKEILSEKPGGCMNVIELPEERESLLAIQKFYPIFQSEEAVIVWGRKEKDGYQWKEVQKLPFVHRIDVVHSQGEDYLLAASLCKTKKYMDDWNHPGSIYAGKIDYDKQEIIGFKPICTDIYKNHGFTKIGSKGEGGVLVSGTLGVFLLTPPSHEGGEWKKEIYINEPASDAVITDMDGDGEMEIGVIAPFHGENFRIYKKIDEKWKVVYELPETHEFGHAIWGGKYNGKDAFMVGFRGGLMDLKMITYENETYKVHRIAEGVGPANVTVVYGKDGDYICAANRQTDRFTIYKQIEE